MPNDNDNKLVTLADLGEAYNALYARDVMDASDKAKLDGIEAGAQVNTVTSVNSQTGAVTITPANIGAVIDISTGPSWTEWTNPLPYNVGDENIDHIKSNFLAIFDIMKVYPYKTCMGTWFKSGWVMFWGYAYEDGTYGDLFYKAVGNSPLFYHGRLANNTITVLSVNETVLG